MNLHKKYKIIETFDLYKNQTKVYLKNLNEDLKNFNCKLLIVLDVIAYSKQEEQETYEINIINNNIGHLKKTIKINTLTFNGDKDLQQELNKNKNKLKYKSLMYILPILKNIENLEELKEEEFIFISTNVLFKDLIKFDDIKTVIKPINKERKNKKMFNKNDFEDLKTMYQDLKKSIIKHIEILNLELETYETNKKNINSEIEKLQDARKIQSILKIEPPFDQFDGFKELNLIFSNQEEIYKNIGKHQNEIKERVIKLLNEKEKELNILNNLIDFTNNQLKEE